MLPRLYQKNIDTSNSSRYQFLCFCICTYPNKISKTAQILLARLEVVPDKIGKYVLFHKARGKTHHPDRHPSNSVLNSSVDWFPRE